MKKIYFILKKNRYLILILTSFSGTFFNPAYAYGGPGLAIGALIVLITIIISFFASFFLKIFEITKKVIRFLVINKSKRRGKLLNKKRNENK